MWVLEAHPHELWLPRPYSYTGAGGGAGALVGSDASGPARIGGGVQCLVAGLAHALQGDHLVGKYCCLLCPKEFSSESGVKYHILKTHAEVGWAGGLAGPGADGLTPQRGMGQGGSGGVVTCVAFEGAAKVRRAGGFP